MIKKHKRQDNRKFYRVNERISAPQLRVLGSDGKQIDVLGRLEALNLARNEGLDLVEIAPMANPPVAKIIDYKKFLYQEEKKHREEKRKAKVSETKEVRLGPFMSDNDIQTMVSRAKGFLEDGNKVKFVVKFRGRQIIRSNFGFELLTKVFKTLEDVSKVDKEPRLEGKQILAIVSPERKNKNAKTEN